MIKKLKGTIAFVHWYHWLVISLSLLLTVIAWKVADDQVEEKRLELFKIQTEQLLAQVSKRMSHYEIGLKAGAAAIQSIAQSTQVEEWEKFSTALNIAETYPGINGIGVIYYVQPDKLNSFLDNQRRSRPDFKIHPIHDEQEYWPITYIEPLVNNKKAVGLDIAFEKNRLSAAKKARDTGTTQITEPIILIQDAKRTPGFLQYIPFYNSQNIDTLEQRQKSFVGHVYAPFIMSKLIEGAFAQSNRQLIFKISDGKDVLYNELEPTNQHYDKKPIFRKEVLLDMYGRPWKFHIQTASYFRSSTSSNQPLIILGSGLVIDIMLLFLFLTLTRSQQNAVVLAKKITRELSNKEEYYRNITSSAPCGIIIANESGEIETVNPQACVLFGYKEEELIGKNVDLLIPIKYQHQHPQHRKNFIENPSHRRMGLGRDIFGLTKKGDEFPAEIGLAQFSNEEGSKTLATIIDMTEHVQVTEELKRSNKDLNDFAYVASHDLKAPLRGIMQLSAWIEEDIAEYANEDTKSNLKLLMNRTSRLEKLLEDLLDYSRIGRKVGDIQTVDTKELALSIFDLQDAPKNITFTCEGDMPLISTKITPLETVMRNLIGNAIKHNNKTDCIITIRAEEHPKYYEFSVEDNGPGIPMQYHEKIFELFKTLQPRDELEGSGMGLSIIKKLIDYQGGSIVVKSDGENGTCFTFTWLK